ncbi:MAG: tetratricopeptide repeat protein [Proteobacteria bacterium]|nr:tetratricopeptide repeat protein [Pseudomonadota bacterium]
MAHLDLEEQEQLAQLKSWWETYGNLLIMGLLLVAVVFSGWQGWRYWQDKQASEASNLFETLGKSMQGGDPKAVRDASGELLEKYPGTLYASMGALSSARYFFDKGDLKSAKAQLEWVVDKTKSDEFRDIARLRLVNVLLDEKAYDEGLKLLEAGHGASFDAQYAALKGDLLVAKGQPAEAKAAYKAAIEKAGKKSAGLRESVQMRLDALGG